MLDTFYLDGIDGKTLKSREKDTTKSVSNGDTESGLKRTEFELTELGVGLHHYNLIRFLKC
jgi:hypothetical protein